MTEHNVVIIGSGAAGYSAADWLLRYGVNDVAIVTENRLYGTSRNAGSDKQTYYKISFTEDDSAKRMAETLASGGGMHGDTAYVEAVNSARCFFRLVDYGVPFPKDGFGRYVGYRTDHDTTARATSAGPLTSKYMTECLERSALKRGAILIDGATVLKIITENNRAIGVIVLIKRAENLEIMSIKANYIVLATGGAANVYENTVYPVSQSGALGLAIDAGCDLENLTEWQYGIASVDVRWNLSGSYQQVIPRYYSVDSTGREYDFLKDAFQSEICACDAVFKKGYEWPFDAKKTQGSSKVDSAVVAELRKGREVFLDYRRNPDGYRFENLCGEAQSYLTNADANADTPMERLKKLNPKAVSFYDANGIDLSAEPLKISVCAQHMNGGVAVDRNYESSVSNLFAVGEAAGTFGIYRPGGSALNSTQVGGLRLAETISFRDACNTGKNCSDNAKIAEILEARVREQKEDLKRCAERGAERIDFKKDMSRCAANIRVYEDIERLYAAICETSRQPYFKIENPSDADEVRNLYRYRDALAAQKAILKTMLESIPTIGSRGGSVSFRKGKQVAENAEYRNKTIVTQGDRVFFRDLRPMPDGDFNFERVWKEFCLRTEKDGNAGY